MFKVILQKFCEHPELNERQMSNFPAMYGENTALMEAMGYSSVQSASSHQPGSQVFTLEFPLD